LKNLKIYDFIFIYCPTCYLCCLTGNNNPGYSGDKTGNLNVRDELSVEVYRYYDKLVMIKLTMIVN